MHGETRIEEFLCHVHDPGGRLGDFFARLKPVLQNGGHYALCIGSTETSDIEWISAAGVDAAARRLTPAIDAEALVLGAPKSADKVPVSPRGIVSPVVLSRAMLDLVRCRVDVFDCGAFHAPKIDHERIGARPARSIETGQALPLEHAYDLFEQGKRVGGRLASEARYLVIAECVPAGTTTALGVLTGLGYGANRLVSSSMPLANHDERQLLVRQGLANAGKQPLEIVAAVGDPMQPFAAGVLIEASKNIPVLLGGGTQMLAVYALAAAMEGKELLEQRPVAVVTTKWVAFDQGSDPASLADLVGAPFAASCPNFHSSRHPGLQAYEEGNVKEGVGAGALMALASLSGRTEREICAAIDNQYDLMVGKS
jgi:uncharacterized protein (TIGR00303 family)